MLDVRHFSSKSRAFLAMAFMATTFLTGCNQTTGSVFGNGLALTKKSETTQTSQVTEQTISAQKSTDTIKVGTVDKNIVSKSKATYAPNENSSWCNYLKNDAAANAEIVASPSLSASTDQDGNGSFNLGINVLDFKKAELIRQSADARCMAHAAGKSIEVTMRLVDESTKFASNYATYSYLSSRVDRMNALVNEANALTAAGVLTLQQSNEVSARRDKIISEMNLAKSEADKRKDIPAIDETVIAGSNQRLYQATADLQRIDRDIRTIEAFDISVQAGYRYDDLETGGSSSDDYFAKVKLGVRLGALSNRRSRYEDAAEAARMDALGEENAGPIWQSGFAASSIGKALAGLRSARSNLVSALSTANETATKIGASDRPEVTYAAFQAKLGAINIGGQLAGVDASIKELENNQRRLSALAR
jgi:hypothetical protein